MKTGSLFLCLCVLVLRETAFSQTNQPDRLYLPFLDKESQSNVIVTLNLSGLGEPCPLEYTNVLSNTNLFTLDEQKTIQEVFVKYKNVTTNSGPPGTGQIGLCKTNYVVKAMNKDLPVEKWVAHFQYTNSDAQEEIFLGGGVLFAKFYDKSRNGYNVTFTSTAAGPILRFVEIKRGLINGVLAEFSNPHQSWTNDYRHAEFAGCPVDEYQQYTNGLIHGKYLMWHLEDNRLILEADFKEPYDFQTHRTDQQISSGH